MDNVYQELLQLIRTEGAYFNRNTLEIGTVKNCSPLQIHYKGMLFDRSEVKISEHLLEHTVLVNLLDENDASIILRDAENRIVSSLDIVKKIKIPSTLTVEDKVIVYLQEDVLWVLCKVV